MAAIGNIFDAVAIHQDQMQAAAVFAAQQQEKVVVAMSGERGIDYDQVVGRAALPCRLNLGQRVLVAIGGDTVEAPLGE